MFRIFIILLLCTATAVAESGKTGLRKLWGSRQYTTNSVPTAWRPDKISVTTTNVSEFERFTLESLSISTFIARFGLPSRYLVTQRREGQDFLIYDLPSGHAVALYVYKPPFDKFGAIVIIKSDGELVRLIK
jgi:hypothetical protein